ncbi:MFS general substrate transporter [Aspergillus saccharolyticus JOP 1030-1]|uniref:MFS general substrate transporter n=1 Tax=Aspergillus saccharolyticus JOP 1030-1 TaxID=1450539 RepID=A0A319A2R7_9EURO|nr:MFS general substrate transporter [Aspergillus saccharolyticus JOP 1030-1]PYH46518.1 MFS general substrate transporter [Aspergillus saccharolyticus JOP 1030-1]
MGLLPQVKLYLNPWGNYEDFRYHTSAQRQNFIISRLKNARRREWLWVVVVAGTGFFADAYFIFSVNMVTPILSAVYWHKIKLKSNTLHNYQVALAIATLGGALVGQILFGIAADIWGRRKMYGWELIILIFSTLGMSRASSGQDNSMSMIGVVLSGGSSWALAPTRIRGRMLAVVFLCQSLGEAAAAVVALIAVAGFRNSLPDDPSSLESFVAIWFRMTIIESPRYTADVMNNSLQAAADASQFCRPTELPATSMSSLGTDSMSLTHTRTHEGHTISPMISRGSDWGVSESLTNPRLSMWKDFRAFLNRIHNLRTLVATSLCWFCLDLPFYGLGLMNAEIINTIWYGQAIQPAGVYQYLLRVSYQSIVVISSGAIVGSAIAAMTVDRIGRRNLQLLGFGWLFILNVIISAAFRYLSEHGDASALVVLYVLTQTFFNFGPNTTTYIVPAEPFLTRFRCTCHSSAVLSGLCGLWQWC